LSDALNENKKPKADSTMKNKNKYNFATRAALLAFALTAAFALNTTAIAQAPPGSLWYNGDWNHVQFLANERNTVVSQAAVYDDFNVTAPLWDVTAFVLGAASVNDSIWGSQVRFSFNVKLGDADVFFKHRDVTDNVYLSESSQYETSHSTSLVVFGQLDLDIIGRWRSCASVSSNSDRSHDLFRKAVSLIR
jgi:hypothetical protein